MSAADPFYLVKAEIDDSVKKIEAKLGVWEHRNTDSSLKKELTADVESLEWQINELDKAVTVAERDPARFSIDASEIVSRKRWSASTHQKIDNFRRALQESKKAGNDNFSAVRRELMRLQDEPKPNRGVVEANDDFLVLESERQALILKEQDQDLEHLSETVGRIGDIGLSIHGELAHQEKIIDDLDKDMEGTAGRLEFVQRRVAHVLKKAGWRGRICLIVSLLVLLFILTMLVFLT